MWHEASEEKFESPGINKAACERERTTHAKWNGTMRQLVATLSKVAGANPKEGKNVNQASYMADEQFVKLSKQVMKKCTLPN